MASPSMQFWGVEVKGKQPCEVTIDEGTIIHVSQITLGDIKKDKESVMVHVKAGDQKLVMGLLSQDTPQLSFDLVFENTFEISHNWKNGSVHLLGYKAVMPDNAMEFESSDDEEEDVPIAVENGQLAGAVKPPVEKPKVENKPKDDSDEDDTDNDEDSDDESDDELDADEKMGSSDSDDEEDDDEEDSEDSEDEKPAIVANAGKKRSNTDVKTPQSKKAKITTPQKTEEKKGKGVVHVATPHPSKKSGKTPSGKTPQSGGSDVSCGSCKKTFKSDMALKSHSQAKHGSK